VVTTAGTALIAAGLLLAVWILRHRAGAVPNESLAWTRLLFGVATISTSVLVGQLTNIVTADRPGVSGIGDIVVSVGCVLACGFFYQGLIHWNRVRLEDVDPGDSVNGGSAVLAMVGLGNLILPHFHRPQFWVAQWQQQASLWALGALFVVFGAAVGISIMAGLRRDARIWLMIAAWGAALLAEIAGLASGGSQRPLITGVWLGAAALILICVVMPARLGLPPAKAAAEQATIFGALVVLVAGMIILTLDEDLSVGGSRLGTVYGVAAVLGSGVRILQLVQDLSNLAQSRREAMTDELTGIPNRRALLAALDEALQSANSTTLLIIDLDRFKLINDRYGHEAGDEVLRHLAQAFSVHVPDGGILARLGGDEFAVLLVDVDLDRSTEVAHELAAAAAPLSDVKGRLLQVGASVGVATVVGPEVEGGELLRRADAAMYRAKTSGDGVRRYDPAVDALAQEQLGLVEELHLALQGPAINLEQIVVYFQPQLDTRSGRVVGAEALVRWEHPRRGLLAPDIFIHLAEENELMASLTARVMREAVLQAACWREVGYRLRVAVNLSASGLSHLSLLPLIDEVLATGMAPADLVLEVTETSLMKDPVEGLAAMHRIAARGVGISIDDYGTGYSSLSYMNDLPATELKIDRSFTARTTSDPRTAAIVAGTVELAHRLGMRLIAEGVEDEATLIAMSQLGCDETQGYLHSRPLPAHLFIGWLQARTAAAAADAQPEGSRT
jgi:diguanylate cyclase (GGDEF)-like protein